LTDGNKNVPVLDELSEEEAARRRDEVIRRMATPRPQHRSPRDRSKETEKKAAVDRGAQKRGVPRAKA